MAKMDHSCAISSLKVRYLHHGDHSVAIDQEWMLFSPVMPTKTVEAKKSDLKKVFGSLENKVEEVTNFNQ